MQQKADLWYRIFVPDDRFGNGLWVNFEKRLYLFLEYRSLRNEFLKIDKTEIQPEVMTAEP